MGMTPYEEMSAPVEAWCEKHLYTDMLVTMRIKGHWDPVPHEITEVLEFDGNNITFTWATDWWEGEEYVELLGFLPVSGIRLYNLKEMLGPDLPVDWPPPGSSSVRIYPVQEAATAEWTGGADPQCSRCGESAAAGYDEAPYCTRFCPHCGARMTNGED